MSKFKHIEENVRFKETGDLAIKCEIAYQLKRIADMLQPPTPKPIIIRHGK